MSTLGTFLDPQTGLEDETWLGLCTNKLLTESLTVIIFYIELPARNHLIYKKEKIIILRNPSCLIATFKRMRPPALIFRRYLEYLNLTSLWSSPAV